MPERLPLFPLGLVLLPGLLLPLHVFEERYRDLVRDLLALPGDDEYLLAAARRLRAPSTWRAFVVEQRALFSDLPVLQNMLARIAARTRILIGSEDRVVPLEAVSELTESIPRAELELVPGAGHLLPMRRPHDVVQAISYVT